VHIFTVSAAMIGACLTVVGFFRALGRAAQESTIGDNLVAIDALVFLAACVLSYFAIRTRRHRRRYTIERLADLLFLCALAFMALICGPIAYEFI
jgi:multisubunit Na+/H+ antiporter MnhF subunit